MLITFNTMGYVYISKIFNMFFTVAYSADT